MKKHLLSLERLYKNEDPFPTVNVEGWHFPDKYQSWLRKVLVKWFIGERYFFLLDWIRPVSPATALTKLCSFSFLEDFSVSNFRWDRKFWGIRIFWWYFLVETAVHFFTFWEKVNSTFPFILMITPPTDMQICILLDVNPGHFYSKHFT